MTVSTEDKAHWVKEYGLEAEAKFCELVQAELHLDLQINPAKLPPLNDKYAPDLLLDGRTLGDLKQQLAPFFQARERFNLDPNWAVAFNVKDYRRYKEHGYDRTGLLLFYRVIYRRDTKRLLNVDYAILGLDGIWLVPFERLAFLIESNMLSTHEYKRRQEDQAGNARDSYYFDLRWFQCLKRWPSGEIYVEAE